MAKPPSLTSMSSLSEIIGTSSQSPATPYIPDYTVRAITDLQYIRIRRAHYMVALHATLLERQRRQAQSDGSQGAPAVTSDDEEDAFTKEWRRAQRVLSTSPTTRSPAGSMRDTGSMRDDVSVRDIGVSNVATDDARSEVGIKTDFTVGYSPDRHHSVSPRSPPESTSPVSPTSDAFKRHLESRLLA